MVRQISERQVRVCMIMADIASIAELSRQSGVSRPKIYELMGAGNPYQDALTKIAEALNVDPEELLADEGVR